MIPRSVCIQVIFSSLTFLFIAYHPICEHQTTALPFRLICFWCQFSHVGCFRGDPVPLLAKRGKPLSHSRKHTRIFLLVCHTHPWFQPLTISEFVIIMTVSRSCLKNFPEWGFGVKTYCDLSKENTEGLSGSTPNHEFCYKLMNFPQLILLKDPYLCEAVRLIQPQGLLGSWFRTGTLLSAYVFQAVVIIGLYT